MRLSSNIIGNSDDHTNFPHKLLLVKKQVANIRQAFLNNLPTDIKLSKTQSSKMIQSGRFLGRIFGTLPITGLLLMKNKIKPWAKSVLIPLGLTAAASAADTGINEKILRSGHPSDSALHNTILIISNDEVEDIIKRAKSLKDSHSLLKEVSEIIENETIKQKGGFLSMLLGTLGTNLLGNMLGDKRTNRTGEGFIRAG